MLIPVLGALLALLVVGAWASRTIARRPVPRASLERFAQQHRVPVTPANGDRLIRYLAVTHRWQATGLAGGLLVSIGWTVAHDGVVGVNSLALVAGWFAGALVAEVRLAVRPIGPRRAASLTPRLPVDYLSRAAWLLLPAAALASLAATVALVVVAARGAAASAGAIVASVAAIGIAVLARLVQFRVLRRPQPVAEPDVLAVDHAIRSRSLHMLAGGGAGLVLYCVLVQLGALAPALPADLRLVAEGAALVGVVAVPVLGWLVATARWGARPAAPVPATGAA